MNRRQLLKTSAGCGAHMLALACFAPRAMSQVFAVGQETEVAAEEKWGRLEKVDEGIWALVSTPFSTKNYTTVCNGGIIAGDKGLLAVESFASPKGATWLAEQAKRLTGKLPTDVVSTHYHGDHTGGHQGYFVNDRSPKLWLTDATQEKATQSFTRGGRNARPFQNVSKIAAQGVTKIDLGNRQINLVARQGHTTSDVTVEVVDPKVVFTGDLFFNRMFPNYTDATPSQLNQYADQLISASDVKYVPGHGPVADADALKTYKDFLGVIEESARADFKAGKSFAEAAKAFKLPEKLSDWFIWSPQNVANAYRAWYRELKA